MAWSPLAEFSSSSVGDLEIPADWPTLDPGSSTTMDSLSASAIHLGGEVVQA
jgi:hypothetical protein